MEISMKQIKMYFIVGMLVLLLLASCKTAPKVDTMSTTATPTVTAPADTTADVTPAETLDSELETEELDTIDSELDDLTW